MKGQAGIEAMVLVTIIAIVLAFTIITFGLRSSEIDDLKIRLEADKLCTITKNSINQVASNGHGSRNEIDLPEKLFFLNYTATVHASDKKIIFAWEEESVICDILTPNVTNSTHATFDVFLGKNVIRNVGGVVVLNATS